MLSALCTVLLVAAASFPPAPEAPPASIDAVLQKALASDRTGMVRVIVRAKPNRSDDSIVAIESLRGTILTRHAFIEAVTARLELHAVPTLRRHPAVASISSDGPVEPMDSRP